MVFRDEEEESSGSFFFVSLGKYLGIGFSVFVVDGSSFFSRFFFFWKLIEGGL